MKKLLSIAFLAALLCSCEPSSVRNGRDLYMLYFEETFKDPSSIKVYSEEYEVNENSKVGEVKWTLEVEIHIFAQTGILVISVALNAPGRSCYCWGFVLFICQLWDTS